MSASLDIYDAGRNDRLSIGERLGGPAGVQVWDHAGKLRSLPAQGPADERECSLEFWGPRRRLSRGHRRWPDGGHGLELLDERGTLRARLGQRGDVGAPTIEP